MAAFLIESVEGDRPYTTKQGIDLVAYTVRFKGEQGAGIAELSQKPETAPPAQGETIDAELIPSNNPDWPARLKRVPKPYGQMSGPGPVGRGRDPKDTAQIVRQHSQHVAILWAATLQKEHGKLPLAEGEQTHEWLKRLIDFFDADVRDNSGQT